MSTESIKHEWVELTDWDHEGSESVTTDDSVVVHDVLGHHLNELSKGVSIILRELVALGQWSRSIHHSGS